MKFNIGDSVIYSFPDPGNPEDDKFIGEVEDVSDTFIFIKNERNIRLRVSSKNFYLVSPMKKKVKL
ncbi:MAG: hypothetical protein M1495_11610 [Bacteroidetes bacterium]|nr:hypothetical protein [Bacteroidota bacterium]